MPRNPTEVEIEVDKGSEQVPMDLDKPVRGEGQSGVKSTPKDVVINSNSGESSGASYKMPSGVLSTPKEAVVNKSSSCGSGSVSSANRYN